MPRSRASLACCTGLFLVLFLAEAGQILAVIVVVIVVIAVVSRGSLARGHDRWALGPYQRQDTYIRGSGAGDARGLNHHNDAELRIGVPFESEDI